MKSSMPLIDPARLRLLAEERLSLRAERRPDEPLEHADARALLHSLDLYRVELEIQQEHLVQANRLLQESHDRYAELYHGAPVGHLSLDSGHCITEYNPVAAAILNERLRELAGRPFACFVTGADLPLWEGFLARLATGAGEESCELRLSAVGTAKRAWVRIDAKRGSGAGELLVALADITERKVLEDRNALLQGRLQQKEKMEALGSLAGGVAHDFNTMLQIMLSNVELMQANEPLTNTATQRLDEMHQAIGRSMGLVNQLLAFACKGPALPAPLRADKAIGAIIGMLERVAGDQVDVVFRAGAPTATVLFDPVQFDQVLMNLTSNAGRAIESSGSLVIATSLVGPAPGWLRLSFRDSGRGMEPATLERIFEPFFTTQSANGGTGLGLSTVYGIVERHGGTIEAASEPGKGSTFTILLPLLAASRGVA